MSEQPKTSRFREGLFGDRNFRLIWGAASISAFGYYVTDIAIPLLAIDELNVTAFEAGYIRVIQQMPNLLFGLFLGVLVDRVRKKPLLIWSDLIRVLVLLIVPIAAFRDHLNLPLICVVVFFIGTFNLLFDIADGAFIPMVVPRDKLVDGNSKIEASYATAQMGGPAIGGTLVSIFTAPYAILITALTLISSAFLIRKTDIVEPVPHVEHETSVAADIKEGMKFVLHHPTLRRVTLTMLGHSFFGWIFLSVYVLYMKRDLEISDFQVGLVFAAGGLGALMGTLVTPAMNRRFGVGPVMVVGNLMFGVTGMLIPVAVLFPDHALPIVIVCEFLQYLCELPFFLNAITLLQMQSPDQIRGRVMSTRKFLTWGVQPFGSLLGGVLGGLVTLPWTLAIGEFGLLAVGIWLATTPLRAMRTVPEREDYAYVA